MGGKQNRRRQHILLFPAACLICFIAATGCRTAVEPLEGGIGAGYDQQELQLLDQAESFLQINDYARALDLVGQALSCCSGRHPDRALHILETALTAQDNPMGSHSQAIRCFKGLNHSLSISTSGPAARCWAAALNEVLTRESEIQGLKNTIYELELQIERLKAVDLEPVTPIPGDNVP